MAQSDSSSQHHTVCQEFFARVNELSDEQFLSVQRRESVSHVTWREFGAQVAQISFGLRHIGLIPGAAVAIVGENSLQWLCADLATLAAGLPNVVISPSVADFTLLKILHHAECRAVFVDDEAAAGRMLNLKSQLPKLDHVIVMGESPNTTYGVTLWQELLSQGRSQASTSIESMLQAIHPGDLATIMYTSGSTGDPKGVMRTHENLVANITNGTPLVRSSRDDFTVIILSLNHLLGRHGFLKSAVTGRSTAIIEDTECNCDLSVIRAMRPTALTLVPRVMERLWLQLLALENNDAIWCELEAIAPNLQVEPRAQQLRSLLASRTRATLGGRLKYITYGGAIMPERIQHYFALVGVPLIGSYGSTECGGVTLCNIGDLRPGNLGKPFPNIELRLADDGEILVRGPTVTPGYFKNPQATAESIDAEGWLHSGDLGALESDGSLRIVGRKKEVFYCADGSNIYPSAIEALLEGEPVVRQAIIVGDHCPFLAALIVPDKAAMALVLGKPEGSLSKDEMNSILRTTIDTLNGRLNAGERVREYVVLDADFPPAVRSITQFQKIKIDRRAVLDHYRATIDAIYTRT